jgi:putative tricarboxylic transport membrane protein
MALKGQADKALVTAAVASFVGGTVSNVLFTAFAPPLATVALKFGNPEIFALMLLAFATFVGLGGDDIPKTIFSICFGLVMATVGFDIISGEPRLIFFDITGFTHGIRFLVLAIGVYGIGEMIWTINTSRYKSTMSEVKITVDGILQAVAEFRFAWRGR